jgi:hypothetical protein
MRRMFRSECEMSISVGGSSIDFGHQCLLLPDDQNFQETLLLDSISMVNLMGMTHFCWKNLPYT